jgi:homoserine dehydrogenase
MNSLSQEPFRIGIAGLGTVGVGVVKILQENSDVISLRVGRKIEIVSVTAGNKDKDRGIDVSSYEWAGSLEAMAQDNRLDAILELIGGSDGPVKQFVETALQNKKHVVTANKALMAHHGLALSELAEENNVTIAYEAAVAGGIPVIKNLREGLAANNIKRLYGILNGTCNYILTEMRETGRDFDDVLKEAQEKGYAEADPTFDVEGIDAAHKLALLTALAFGVKPDFETLNVTGISHITAEDIQFADELGYRIKLIGLAAHIDGDYVQSMEPCLVPINSSLGAVEGVFNAVYTEGDFVDKTMMEGRGAGEGPTASSVVADIIDLARGDIRPVFGVPVKQLMDVPLKYTDNMQAQCYIHLHVKDEPGVLVDITAELKKANISIDSFIQRGHKEDNTASVVIVTHESIMSDAQKAASNVEKLASVLDKPTLLRIEHM